MMLCSVSNTIILLALTEKKVLFLGEQQTRDENEIRSAKLTKEERYLLTPEVVPSKIIRARDGYNPVAASFSPPVLLGMGSVFVVMV